MATDYSANPRDVKNFTQSAEVNYDQSIDDYSEFLPAINRTESLKRFFGSTVNQLLSSGSTQSIDAYWGRLAGRNYNPDNELFNPENNAIRLNYQFQPGTVSKLEGETQQTISYINWLQRLESLGADLNNHDRLFSEPGYTLDLPVNSDMMVNYSNYYWLEGEIPLIEIEATVTDPIDIDTIVAQSQYTTPILGNYRSVEFVTGLRVKFTGAYVSSTSGDYFADYTYYVENVGGAGGIKLLAIEDDMGNDLFPSITPYEIESREGWDTVDWDTTPWDGIAPFEDYSIETTNTRDDLNLNKSYIVMERWASDKNPWARTNKWFSIHALTIATTFNDLNLEAYLNTRTRADRPIIEFKADMELFNTCKTFVETVDYVVSLDQVTAMLTGVPEFLVDPENALQNGDIILVAKEEEGGIELVEYNNDFNNDFDSGNPQAGSFGSPFSRAFNLGVQTTFFQEAFTVSGVGTSITLTPYATYNDDEYVIVSKGTEKGEIYCLKDGEWGLAQNKIKRGTPPLFKLFDETTTALEDFPNNDFVGDKIFGYQIDSTGAFDRELGFAPSFTDQGSFNNFRFEWTLSNNRYNENITIDTSQEIRGYYYFRNWVEDTYFNGWSNIRDGQRVPIIQTQIADGVNQVVFELGTDAVMQPEEFTVSFSNSEYRWYSNSYIDRTPIGYPNPEFVWKYDTTYVINDLIQGTTDKLEFVDPFGNVDPNITVTVISDTLINFSVANAYVYDKVLYRSQNDSTIGGEIILSNENQNRYLVQLNGRRLEEGIDFTFSGTQITVNATTQTDDVLELMYIADTDLQNVVYDVAPIHFYNSDNNPFTNVGYDDLINHFGRQLSAMPGYVGDLNGINNYHRALRLHTFDGLIRQQIFRTKNIQYLLDQEDINPIRALKSFAKDYSDFKRFFQNKVRQLWNTQAWDSVRDLVDQTLSDINIGKNETFKYAHSDMAYFKQDRSVAYILTDALTTTFALPEVINQYGDTQNHLQVFLRDFDIALDKYVERPLTKGIDYTIEGPNLELNATIGFSINNVSNGLDNVVSGVDNVVVSGTGGSTDDSPILIVRWYDYKQLSGIPFSAVKLGFFRPTQVEIIDNQLVGHDGSRYTLTGSELIDMDSVDFDVVGAALWDFELRVANNLVDRHSPGVDMGADMLDLYPNPSSEFSYDVADMNTRLDDWYNRYAIRNNIVEIDDVDYDAGDEFTWNYKTVGPNLGSWRSLYVYTFGTDRPHTHPWEMLGHRIKPTWWDATYSWDAGPLRVALINALKYGISGNATTADLVDIRYAHPTYDWDANTLVTDDGSTTLNGPVTAGVVASPTSVDAAQDFVFGDWSEIENTWRKSSEYLFALAEVFLQLKPYRTHETFWMLDRWNVNQVVTQEQWVDPDTCQRLHIEELHNQLITDGIISKINVVSGGTGYSFLDIEFNADKNCYSEPSAEAFTNSGNVVAVTVTDPGRGFVSEPDATLTGPIASEGVELEYEIDQNFIVTHLGFNTLPAEEYRTNVEITNDLATLLSGLDINYMLQVGGFTDKRILSLELDGDYASGQIRIPENSYDIQIDRNAPNKIAFYSGVKIEKIDGQGYRVDGYNLDSRFFNFLKPSTAGKQTGVTVGNFEVVKYQNWRNEVSRIPYRSIFTKRQELYNFLLGLGRYYESIGFDQYTQWEVEAREALEWSLDSSQTDDFFVNGIDSTITYKQGSEGVVQTVDVNYDGVFNVLDSTFKNIRRNELLVLRDEETTEYSLKSEEDRIYGLGVRVVEFEHVIVIDNVSTFNDPIYQPEIGIGQNRIRFVGERTRNWNGRVEAPGYLVRDTGLILNMESSVRELENDWITSESKALERLTRQTIGFNVGYSKPTYMTNTFIGDQASYQFEKGERKYKGTREAFDAMSRNKNIFGDEFAHEFYEEWMVRLGDYGDVSERNPIQFALNLDKVKTDPQHFRFTDGFVSDRTEDLIIDIGAGSEDAISGDFGSPFEVYDVLRLDNTSIQDLEPFQEFTRDAGLPLVTEIEYFLGSIDNIGDIYDPTQDYAMIPNWTNTTAYVQTDVVRRFGNVYRLLIDSTSITNINDDITIRGTQVFPQVANGLTFIANDVTVTFAKTDSSVSFDDIILGGTVTNPTVPSGDTLVLDGINVNFIKTETVTTYEDIVLVGNVTNPTIVNSPSRQLTVSYANNDSVPLTDVVVDFNELSSTLTMQQIWINALTDASATTPSGETNARLLALEALRTAYVGVNGSAAWETFVDNYYDASPNPDRYLNPEYLGTQVNANLGAAWETEARALINLDLDLVADIGAAHTETEATMVSGVLNDSVTWNAARDAANNLLDNNVTASDNNENLQDFRTFVENNGSTTIAAGTNVTVTNPTEYTVDQVADIANKIAAALLAAAAPVDISVSPSGQVITLTRTNNDEGFRLGVSTDVDLGFVDAQNDVETQGNTVTGPVDLDLDEAIIAVNNANITGVSASRFEDRLHINSVNEQLVIGSGTANNDFGFNAGTFNANSNIVTVPVDLGINDVVTQINAASIDNLTASQVEGVLILSYSEAELIIGEGTANTELGIAAGTYESLTDAVQNEFVESEWEIIQDPANFNIWTIDNIGSEPNEPAITTNRYEVYQTSDIGLGVTEICAGQENGDDALIKLDNNHLLAEDDFVLILNSTCIPSVDGIHKVTSIQNDTMFFIDRYIDEKGFTGKVIPLRSVRFATSTEAFNSLNDERYFNGADGLRTGTYVYVDDVLDDNSNSLGYGAVYEVERTANGAGFILVRNEEGKTNNSSIRNGVLYSNKTGDTVIEYEVYDPLKGIIPGIADREIDLRSDVDFAYYNNSTDPFTEIRNENAWGQERVGLVWWDLSTAIYLNYDQSSPDYRQEQWGKLFPTSTIDVYEWTKSPVTPDEYAAAVTAGTVIDGIELTGTPYSVTDRFGEVQYNWCEEVELNVNTNQVDTYYYFWVQNKTTTPSIERVFSVLQLADIIIDPSTQEIDWLAATSENTLLVSSLTNSIGFEELIMQVNFDANPSDYHQEFAMLAENDPQLLIPEWLHISLRDSLAGFTQNFTVYDYEVWESTTTYSPGRTVLSGLGEYYRCHTQSLNNNPDTDTDGDFWMLLEAVEDNPDGDYEGVNTVAIAEPRNIPDLTLHPLARYGLETRPHQTWFTSVDDARRELVEKVNSQLIDINLVDSDLPWREEFERTFDKGGIEYDITDYWNYVNWTRDGFVFERGVGDYFLDFESELSSISNPQEGEVAQIDNSTDSDGRNRRQVFLYENGEWVLVYKERATIQFNDLLWDNDLANTGWDIVGWDTDEWDKDSSTVAVEIFDSFYYNLWVREDVGMYADIWFHMAKHVLREQNEVDWIFKSSYFRYLTEDTLEKQYNKYFTDNADSLFDFINTVKPFRSKMRDGIIRKTADDETSLSTLDSLEIRVQTNPVDSTIDETFTRSFRLSVGNDETNWSSQITEETKVLLGLAIEPDDLIIPILNIGDVNGDRLANSGAIWINGERIEYTGKTNSVTDGIGSGFSSGFSTGFGGVVLLTGITRGTQGTFARRHSYADIVEQEIALTENIVLSDWADNLTPAWNEIGDGLLDADNLDANGVTIRSNAFGTIEPYGIVLYAQWIALQEPASAIESFQNELEELIEVYWAQNYQWLTSDNTLFTADTTEYTADGAKT